MTNAKFLEKGLREGFIQALLLKDSKSGKSGAVFFKILGREFVKFSPFQPSSSDISANASTSGGIVVKSGGNEVLKTDKNNILYQVFYGVKPHQTRIFVEFPRGSFRNSWEKITTREGKDVGYIDGEETPFDDPGLRSELWIARDVGDAVFHFSNPTDHAINPRVNIVGFKYVVEVIQDQESLALLSTLQVPFSSFLMGTVDVPIEVDTQKIWAVIPTTITSLTAAEKARRRARQNRATGGGNQ